MVTTGAGQMPDFKSSIIFTDINECESIPCLNGATCLDGKNNYDCECEPGFTGPNCETGTFKMISLKVSIRKKSKAKAISNF